MQTTPLHVWVTAGEKRRKGGGSGGGAGLLLPGLPCNGLDRSSELGGPGIRTAGTVTGTEAGAIIGRGRVSSRSTGGGDGGNAGIALKAAAAASSVVVPIDAAAARAWAYNR